MKKNIIRITNRLCTNFTLAKLGSALLTITILASIKYAISGNFHLEYSDFFNNIVIGLLGWTLNTGFIAILSDFFCLKGINFNLNQFIFGFETLPVDGRSVSTKSKPKLYLAMESDDGFNKSKSLDKGKEVVPTYNTPVSTWDSIFPPRINPGPGFNVPGGEVPIRDDICKHIDYNSHILNQFKKMDLQTAIEQRNNNISLIKNLEYKLGYAQDALAKIPTKPTTEYEFKLKNQILKDLDDLTNNKTKAEGRTTLLNSRIQFIESKINKN